jgi:hypothetical protein
MYDEQLEKLVEMALLDGELTEKEKQVLFKKAEALGVDLDEFEMVLEAKLFEKHKSMKQEQSKATAAPKSDKLGDVRKCPACGAIVETFATKCPDCGTEFRNIEASQNIIKFFEKLDEIELSRKESIHDSNDDSNSNIGFGTIIKWLFFWYIMLPIKIISFFINKSKPTKWSTTDSRKEELILNFPVPVSREEILEFLTLAGSRINSNTYFNAFSEETKYKDAWNKIWLKKIEQIHSKAGLAMKDDKKSFDDVKNIAESARHAVKNNNKKALHITLGFITLIAALIIWGIVSSKIDESHLKEQKELKTEAETFIKAGEYGKAEEIILKLENELFKLELISEIQLDELTKELNALEVFLNKKQYSKLKLELEKITWTKNSDGLVFGAPMLERESFKTFLKKKEALNNQLPEKYRIEIESEDSL